MTFWALTAEQVAKELQSAATGLTSEEAGRRLKAYGANVLRPGGGANAVSLLARQFKNPITLILICAASLSIYLHESTDAIIIFAIVLVSGLLGFWQEWTASNAVEKLLELVQITAAVLRDGTVQRIAADEVVPGDVVRLSAGRSIPADCLILESKDLFVSEAALTGETFPVEKEPGVVPGDAASGKRTNALFMGTHVVSGTASALVVRTGAATDFGGIAERLRLRPVETDFEHGVQRFGYFLLELTLILVLAVFAINVFMHRPAIDAFLFSVALAVGLTPQLLPAIISVNLSHGARSMARRKVIVRRLASIVNFGSMDVLCSDKTGTLTQGRAHIRAAWDVEGKESDKVRQYAYLNAAFETGFVNPLDEAIRSQCQVDLSAYRKLDEVPYDFLRKRLSVLVAKGDQRLMVTKGAVPQVLSVCTKAETAAGRIEELPSVQPRIEERFNELSRQGLRTIAVAYRSMDGRTTAGKDAEAEMTFLGLLAFEDPPKPGVAETLKRLKDIGVSLKIVTGDSRLVAADVSRQVGLASAQMLTGPDLRGMTDEALRGKVGKVDVFAEIEPNQKERVVLALRKAGYVVGFIGDGINDAAAIRAADVGISVDEAVDVAKEAADIVLLERDLGVLERGVLEGRRTFANTLKYVFMATSANFGNMFSMAGASIFLKFLPLLPKQVLLINLLTDLPEMTIATDRVDEELIRSPRSWDIAFIRRFMVVFGPLSSAFDILTFVAVLVVLPGSQDLLRTAWFVESVVSAALIVLVIRSRRPFIASRPGTYLFWATLLVIGAALAIPYSPVAPLFGFRPLPLRVLAMIGVIVALYVVSAEAAKKLFYRAAKARPPGAGSAPSAP
jgi:Mg2+-importing ATPase